ncbi:hypothetical protein [Acinetobacter sp.]|uniref:hypothetical protein n=1 Tax=Acinetobacter sp. TaxID=472 RepID=UPI0028AF431F|nr:hypothetical protein [Acinetobacter sp.]
MKEIYLNSLEEELNYWSPIMEIKTVRDTACNVFINELFPYEKSSKELPEEQYIKECKTLFYQTFFSNHDHPDRQTGIEAEEDFFNSVLGKESDEELKNEYLKTALCQLLNIVCMYVCDAIDVMKNIKKEFKEGEVIIIENQLFTDNKVFFYLCRCNYFLGLCKATHASNIGSRTQLKEKMVKLAEKKNGPLRKKLDEDLLTIQKIWQESNWASYTQCADYIFENKLIERPHRKIYELVSLAAKNK